MDETGVQSSLDRVTHQGPAATDSPVVRPLSSNRWTASALLVLTAIFVVLAAGYTLGGDSVRHGLNVGVYNNVMIAAGLSASPAALG